MWEMIKADVRGESVRYAKNKNRKRNKRIKEIEKELNELEEKRDEQDQNRAEIDEKTERLQIELKNEYDVKVKGTLTRAKIRWLKDGEKNSKYFIGLEKRNYLNKTISCLVNKNGQTVTNINDILEEEKMFYSDLYARKEVNLEDEYINGLFFLRIMKKFQN